jgi:hypothetical protein
MFGGSGTAIGGGGASGTFPGAVPTGPGMGGSISGSHTSTGVESSFTFVTYTFPRPAMPYLLAVTTSAGSGLIEIVLDNQRNILLPFSLNVLAPYNISGVISQAVNALSVGFEALSGVLTVSATVHYQ